jgi:hypothetical protein
MNKYIKHCPTNRLTFQIISNYLKHVKLVSLQIVYSSLTNEI